MFGFWLALKIPKTALYFHFRGFVALNPYFLFLSFWIQEEELEEKENATSGRTTRVLTRRQIMINKKEKTRQTQ